MLEKDFVLQIKEYLEKRGYEVFLEEVPDKYKGYKQPLRVDMIFFRQDIGYFGVEFKTINTFAQGSKLVGAFKQVSRYRQETYFGGKKIDNWAIGFYSNVKIDSKIEIFLASFFQEFDVKLLSYRKYLNKDYNNLYLNRNIKGSLRL
jgi:hypothetical protein